METNQYMLEQDNARCHISLYTHKYLTEILTEPVINKYLENDPLISYICNFEYN